MALTRFPPTPLVGACDANGAATLEIQAPHSYWIAVIVPVQVSAGGPNYAILHGPKATAKLPLAYGSGPRSQLGPFMLAPGEQAVLAISGAAPNAQITGQVVGWQADSEEELPAALANPPPQAAARRNLGSFNVSTNSTAIGTFAIDGSMYGVAIGMDGQLGGAQPGTMRVSGTQSGIQYFPSQSVNGVAGWFGVPGFSSLDTSIDISVQNATLSASVLQVLVDALLTPEAVLAVANPIGQQSMTYSLPVAIANNQTAQAWQAPNQSLIGINLTLAAAATSTLKAAVGSQRIYIFGFSIDYDAAVAGVGMGLQDSAGTPTVFTGSSSTVSSGHSAYHAGAVGPGLNLGLVIKNFSASSLTGRGSLSCSQAL